MNELGLIAWDFKRSQDELHSVLLLGTDSWDRIMLDSGINQFVILSTCNRLEIYFVNPSDKDINPVIQPHQVLHGESAMEHLFRVSSGLESMSVGESEILGQVKDAFDLYTRRGYVGKYLSLIFRKAISVGKLVREKTAISEGKVSIPSLVTDILQRDFGVRGRTVSVVGAGKMGTDLVKYLDKESPGRLIVVTHPGKEVMADCKVEYRVPADLPSVIEDSDIIITATSSKIPIIDDGMLHGDIEKKFFVDISFPPNIEYSVDEIPSVRILRLENLNKILHENQLKKKGEIEKANILILEELENIKGKLLDLLAEDVISEMYTTSRMIEKEEIEEFRRNVMKGEDLDQSARKMVESSMNKLLSLQTFALKNMVKSSRDSVINGFLNNLYDEIAREKRHLLSPEDRQGSRSRRARIPRSVHKP
ncbi:MAG: glutamyl-tRNA reductase [Thermoplasmata archaeon]